MIYIATIMHLLSFLDPFPAFNNNLDNSLKIYILVYLIHFLSLFISIGAVVRMLLNRPTSVAVLWCFV